MLCDCWTQDAKLTFEFPTLWLKFFALSMANEMVTLWDVARSIDWNMFIFLSDPSSGLFNTNHAVCAWGGNVHSKSYGKWICVSESDALFGSLLKLSIAKMVKQMVIFTGSCPEVWNKWRKNDESSLQG